MFAANGSNEVLQTVLLAYADRAAPSRRSSRRIKCTRRSPGSLAQPSSKVSVLPTSRSTLPRSSGCSPNTGRMSCSSRRRTIPQDSSSRPNVSASSSTSRRGWSWSTRRTAQFADWSALDLVSEDLPLVVTRTFSKTWSMAGARLGYLIGPSWLVAELDKVVLPLHLRRGQTDRQAPGTPGLRRHERPRRPHRGRTHPHRGGDERPAARRVPERRQLRAVPCSARCPQRPRRVAGPRRPQRADPRLLQLAATRQLPAASRSARQPRTPSSSPRWPTCWHPPRPE